MNETITEVVEFIERLRCAGHWTHDDRERVARAALAANDWEPGMARLVITSALIENLAAQLPPYPMAGSGC